MIGILNDLKVNHTCDRSIRGLINQLYSHVCTHSDDAEKIMLTNVNTPEDWKKIQDIKSNDEY